MHKWLSFILLSSVFAGIFALPAPAQQDPDWQFCDLREPTSADAAIRGCTRILERGDREPVGNRVKALARRCRAYTIKSDFNRASPDCAEAIRLDRARPLHD
jgi:hypothetical protein